MSQGVLLDESSAKKIFQMIREWENTPKNRIQYRARYPIVDPVVPFQVAITDVDLTTGHCSWAKLILPPGSVWALSTSSLGTKTTNYAFDVGGSTEIVIGDIVTLTPVAGNLLKFLYNPPMMQATTTQNIPSGGAGTATVNGNTITIFNPVANNAVPSSKSVYISFVRNPNPSFPSVGSTNYIAGKGNWVITIAPCNNA